MSARRVPRSLRYVSDDEAGIRRVADPRTLDRIRRLAIPPAYVDVWICRDAHGHLQATGRDARGRKQYRYHGDWRAFRDRRKYEGLAEFGATLPALRRRVDALLRTRALSRDKVLATVVALLDRTLIRVGNEEYARANSSYGLTTLRARHARAGASRVSLDFRGKTGKPHHVVLSDARLARIVRRCRELPGQRLFQYLDDDGRARPVRSNDVNAFLRELTGLDVTARTFRTWGATTLLVEHWLASLAAEPELAAPARMTACIASVAARLRNTATVCRNAYLDPRVVAAIDSGAWPAGEAPRRRGLSSAEARVLDLLRKRAPAH